VSWAAPQSGDSYAAALIETIDFACASRTPLPILASGAGDFRHLQRRLLMIRNGNGKRNLGWTSILVCLAIAALPLSITRGQQAARTEHRAPATLPTTSASSESKPTPAILQAEARSEIQLGRYSATAADGVITIGPADATAKPPIVGKDHEVGYGRARALPQDLAAQAQLDRTWPEVKFSGTRLADVIEHFRQSSDAQIFVNWKALESRGVSRDTPVTLELRSVKFSRCLQIILRMVADDKAELGYAIDQGVISITTNDELAKNTFTRVYDIRDLLRGLDKDPAGARTDAIASMATATIDPKSWRENGGNGGSVRALHGSLIVTQTPENQAQVMSLLERLRGVINAGQPPAEQQSFPLLRAK
jgi:hypothetical protein